MPLRKFGHLIHDGTAFYVNIEHDGVPEEGNFLFHDAKPVKLDSLQGPFVLPELPTDFDSINTLRDHGDDRYRRFLELYINFLNEERFADEERGRISLAKTSSLRKASSTVNDKTPDPMDGKELDSIDGVYIT